MALNQFSSNVYPSLVDWSMMINPDGTIADIAWLLSQANPIVKDIIFQEANGPLAHQVSVNAGLPQGTWRQNNQGVASSKPLFAKYQFGIGELVDYSMVDRSEAELYGQIGKFRYNQDQAHIEGLSQQIATAMFYSNEQVNQSQFTGLSPYYNSLSPAVAQTAKNVVNGGGSGSSNASIWIVGHGDNSTFGIFPKGSTAGLLYEDKGDVTPLYDGLGNRYEGYTSYFRWRIGLAIKDWRYNVRIANLDTTTAGLSGTTPADLNVLLIQAVNKLPTGTRRLNAIDETDAPTDPRPGYNPVMYLNRTVKIAMETQMIRDKNVLLEMRDYAGETIEHWRDLPVRTCDALINGEATIS